MMRTGSIDEGYISWEVKFYEIEQMFWEKKEKVRVFILKGIHFWNASKKASKHSFYEYPTWGSGTQIIHAKEVSQGVKSDLSIKSRWYIEVIMVYHHQFITHWYSITQVNFNVNWQYVCLGECTNKCGSCKEPHSMRETEHRSVVCASRSYWLYGEFQWLAVELVPCCPQVHTRCLWAALPRFPHPGWLPPAACAGSAGHTIILTAT